MGQIQIIGMAVVAVLIIIMGIGLEYYYSSYLDAKEELAKKDSYIAQLNTSLETCSNNTDKLAEADKKKEEEVAKAQEQAKILAKSHEKLAQQILSGNRLDVDSCKSAVSRFQVYKGANK